jgi:uncharacterized protein (TIGR00369 family)
MKTDEFIKFLNAHQPPALQTLGGEVLEFDKENRAAVLRFMAGRSLCNPDGAIQGGFICGMLDAAMANAVFCLLGDIAIVATLEIKVSYLEITRQGELYARATVIRSGKTITFLEAELRDADGGLLATATSTARVISKSPAS